MADSDSKVAAQEGEQAAPAAAPEGVKLFAGNLSFKTTGQALENAFAPHGTVRTANIISRGPRSLGYGFVEMATKAEAEKAMSALNSTEFDGRTITVELAKPNDPSKTRAAKPKPKRRRRKANATNADGGNADGNADDNKPADAGAAAVDGDGKTGPAGKRFAGRRRTRRNRKGKGPAKGDEAGDGAAPAAAKEGDAPAKAAAPRRKRAPRKPREQTPRTPSATTLFVANLPFTIDDDGLKEVFKDLSVVNAYVVRKRNNRSKGFGFVEFGNEADQQAALNKTNNLEVEGRQLVVKVALSAPEGVANGGDGDASSSSAPADGAAAPAAIDAAPAAN